MIQEGKGMKGMKGKWIGIVGILIILISLSGCKMEKERLITIAENMLYEKYGEKFEILDVGERYSYLDTDYPILCAPEGNPTCIFSADIEVKGRYLQDNYVSTLITKEMEKAFSKAFDSMEIQYFVHIGAGSKYTESTDISMTLKEFLKENPKNRFMIYIAVDEDQDMDKLIKESQKALDYIEPINGGFYISMLPQEKVKEVRIYMETHAETDSEMIGIMEEGKQYECQIEEGKLTTEW